MAKIPKQDRVYTRTPSELEQKYYYERTFKDLSEVQTAIEKDNTKIKAELSLKLGVSDSKTLVSMLYASAEVVRIKSDHFELDGDEIYFKDGDLQVNHIGAETCYIGDGYSTYLGIANNIISLGAACSVRTHYEIESGNSAELQINQWVINTDSITYEDANTDTWMEITPQGISGSATNGDTIYWSQLLEILK